MAVFRPSARIRVQLRLDELAETASVRAALERQPPKGGAIAAVETATTIGARSGLQANLEKRTQLESIRETLPAPQLARERAQLNAERAAMQQVDPGGRGAVGVGTRYGQQQTKPRSLVENPLDELNVLFEMLPKECEVSRNGLKDADTAKVTLDFRDLPIDPRCVRAALISISIGTVDADSWESGVLRQRARETDGSLESLVERTPGEELAFDSPTTFVGFVDEWLVDFSEDGDTVELTCRDISALLRDKRLYEAARVNLEVPIDQGIQELIDLLPETRGLRVVYGTPTDPRNPSATTVRGAAPVPADSLPDLYKSPKKKGQKQKRQNTDEPLWDHLQGVCAKLGLTLSLRGFTLYILEPRVLFSSFVGARKMLWGVNIEKLSFARKLTGRKNDTIEVRCPDPSIGRTRWARYPVVGDEPKSGVLGLAGSPQPAVTRANNVTPNGSASESVQVLSVRGVTDLAVLEQIARTTFEEMARQEIEGSMQTNEIDSFESKAAGDLLQLQPGEPLVVAIAPPNDSEVSPSGSSLQELQAQSAARRQQYLEGLGMSPQSARRLAVAQEQAQLINVFRASNVNITWSAEDGVSMDFDFYNFIVVRDGDESPIVPQSSKTLTESVQRALLPGGH